MATYYWVGGAGTWNNSDSTHWAASSGGAGGVGVPTSADNVIFDNLSNATAYAVTVGTNAVAADITIAGPAAGNVTITLGATAVINCYGSWINSATGVVFSTTSGSLITFLATTTGKTITTNNVSIASTGIVFNSASGGWTLGSAFAAFYLNPLAGTFSTGNFNVTLGANLQRSATTGVATINLGSSTVTCGGITAVSLSATNLTLNAGTSTIVCSHPSPTFAGGGSTYYNVSFTSAATGTTTITGANTFTNLTQTSRSAAGQRIVSLAADQTVTGTLTLQTLGTAVATQRTFVQSSVIGTQRTLTAAALSGMADIDFRDIVGAGAASWTGTRIGNCLNNTGITFTAGVNKYWNLAAGGLWSATAWALSAGGAVAAANFPLAQDTVNIDLTTITTGSTINISIAWQVPTVICTRPSGSNTLIMTSGTISPQLYGNWTSCTGMSFTSPTNAWDFVGQGLTQTVTSAGVAFTQGLTVNSPGGTVRVADNLTTGTTATFTLTTGTLDLNSFVLSTGIFVGTGSATRTITSGSGTITITGTNTTVINFGTTTSLTVDTRPTFNLTTSPAVTTGTRLVSVGASGNLPVAPNINVTNGSDTFNTSGTSTVANLNLTGFTGTFGNATRNIYGNLTMNGTMAGVTAGTSGTTFIGVGSQTLTSAGQGLDFPIAFDGVGGTFTLQDALTVGPIGGTSTKTTTLTNGTLVLNGFDLTTGQFSSSNSNVRTLNFGTNKIVVTGNNATVFTIGTSTNLTLLGTPQVEATYTGSTGTRTITPGATFASPEANAVSVRVTAGGDIIQLSTTSSAYKNVEFTSGFTGTVLIANTISVYGDWTFSPNMVTPTTGTGNVNFVSTNATPRTITSNAKTFGGSGITFNGVGGTWQLQDNFGTAPTEGINLANGTLDLNNFGTTSGSFSSTGSTTRAIAFGVAGSITVTGTSSTIFNGPTSSGTGIDLSGNAQVYITGAGPALGTRTVNGGNAAVQLQHFSFTISAGADTISSTAGMTWENMTFTSGFTGILANISRFVYGDVTFHAGMSLGAGTGPFTLGATSGPKAITTAGLTLDFPVTFNGIGGTWAFQDALTMGSTRALTLTNGTLQLKSGTTNTVGSLVTTGTNVKFLQATTPGSQATISAPSGTNAVTYLHITDSNATGGAVWDATSTTNTNGGDNTGWLFTTLPTSGFFAFF